MSSARPLHPQPQPWVRNELGPASSCPSLCTGASAWPGQPHPWCPPGTPGSPHPNTAPSLHPPHLGAGEHACVGLSPPSRGAREGQAGGQPSHCCLSSLSLRVSFCAFCSMGVPLARVWMPRGPAWDHFPFLRSWGTKATPRFRFRGCSGGKKLSEARPAAVGGFRPAVRTRPWKLSQRPPGVGWGTACRASMLPKGSPRGRAVSRWF